MDGEALEELATGPLVKRLQISENSPEGLGQCTREMFALAMLVRLGRITEQDVRSTFAAFKRLDRDNDGLLTSKEIIMSAVERKKKEQRALSNDTRSLLSKQRSPNGKGLLPFESIPLTGHHLPVRPVHNSTGEEPGLASRDRGISFDSLYSAITYNEEGGGDHQQNWADHQNQQNWANHHNQ